jgi:hypothetical protein
VAAVPNGLSLAPLGITIIKKDKPISGFKELR